MRVTLYWANGAYMNSEASEAHWNQWYAELYEQYGPPVFARYDESWEDELD